MSALKRDISRYDGSIRADTVYFGGGTPSLLGAAKISRILDTVSISFELCSPEITLECNPCTVDRNELQKFRAAGINRLSVGVQSLDDSELVFLGRLHDAEQARETIKYAAEVGFENISADLMIGITGQTEESIRRTVTEFRELGVNHISASNTLNEEKQFLFMEGINQLCWDLSQEFNIKSKAIINHFKIKIFALYMHAFRSKNKELLNRAKQKQKEWEINDNIKLVITKFIMSNCITWNFMLRIRKVFCLLKRCFS